MARPLGEAKCLWRKSANSGDVEGFSIQKTGIQGCTLLKSKCGVAVDFSRLRVKGSSGVRSHLLCSDGLWDALLRKEPCLHKCPIAIAPP